MHQKLTSETPWHISRFFPAYRLVDHQITPIETLNLARQIGLEAGLKYVYIGNLPSDGYGDTLCPACQCVLIHRRGYTIQVNKVTEGRCPNCGSLIAGRGLDWAANGRRSFDITRS